MRRGRPSIGGKKMMVSFEPGVAERIDRVSRNRSAFIRAAVEAALRDDKFPREPKPRMKAAKPKAEVHGVPKAEVRVDRRDVDAADLLAYLTQHPMQTARQASVGLQWMEGRVEAAARRLEASGAIWFPGGGAMEVL